MTAENGRPMPPEPSMKPVLFPICSAVPPATGFSLPPSPAQLGLSGAFLPVHASRTQHQVFLVIISLLGDFTQISMIEAKFDSFTALRYKDQFTS